MIREEFRGNAWHSLGVEIELQLVDSRTMGLTGAFDEVHSRLPGDRKGPVKPEFLKCYAEIETGACRTVAEVGDDLARTVRAVERAAEGAGVRLFWGATHPFSRWQEQEITPNPRYFRLAYHLRETVRRPVTFGLHVHVGVPSGDSAVQVIDRLQEHLPVLLALSANSPFWCGRATGLHAHRIELLEGFPTGGLPPLLRDWKDYEALVDRLGDCGFIETEKELWWDARPSRRHGTVEVRICDMPPDLPSVLGLTALIQCLVSDLSREIDLGMRQAIFPHPLMVRQNRWRAARYGLGAELVDPDSCQAVPARQAVRDLVDRLVGVAERLGCVPELQLARAMADGPTGAERQLALHERTNDLAEAVERLCDASSLRGAPGPPPPAGLPSGLDGRSGNGRGPFSSELSAAAPR